MKTAPIQQNQSENQQNEFFGQSPEGKSMTPPTFQLQAGDENGTETPTTDPPVVMTTTNDDARLRGGPPEFAETGSNISQGTRLEVLEEQRKGNSAYIRVKDHDTQQELGWTWKGNVENLDQKYQQANATYHYHVGGNDLIVFLPENGLTDARPDIFMFFHGIGGDYSTDKTHARNGGYEDNPAIAADMAQAVNNSGGIAICPQAKNPGNATREWKAIQEGGFQAMVDQTLARLNADLGRTEQPLTAGNISIAGHSAGGSALGQAALDTGATDVTLQDAGYHYNSFRESWPKLRDWFLLGEAPKTIRVISQVNNRGGTQYPVTGDRELAKGEIVSHSRELVGAGQIPGPVTVEEIAGNDQVEKGGIVLKEGYRVIRSDGQLQGSLRIYEMASGSVDHWGVASETMESSMTAGERDRAADEEFMRDR